MKRSSRAIAKQVIAAAKFKWATSSSESYSSKHRSTMMMTSLAVSTSSCQERQMQRQRHEHHSHHIIANPSSPPPASEASVIITPPPSPQLLLEGDNMYISSDGKAHTYYRLHSSSSEATTASSSSNHNDYIEYLIEEAYDIEHARKEITLLQQLHHSASSNTSSNHHSTTMSTITTQSTQPIQLSKIITFPLQEITNSYYIQTTNNNNNDRTGSTTWDSSIVMSFYFGRHPNQLIGNVLELGSGVGLGGILTRILSNYNCCCCCYDDGSNNNDVTSFTLSEINRDILNMLHYNTAAAAEAVAASSDCTSSGNSDLLKSSCDDDDEFHIERLDWCDFVRANNDTATTANNDATRNKKYDTIIASDCIYLASQIRPLSETIVKLLRRRRQEGKGGGGSNHDTIPKAHIFSPYNRGAIPDLIQALRAKEELIVDVETMELSKFRVKSNHYDDDWNDVSRLNWLLGDENEDDKRQDVVSSCCTSKFLHITVSFRNDDGVKECENDSDMTMIGID